MKQLISLAFLASALPGLAFAQSTVEEPAPPKFIFGPVGVTPRIAVRNLGFDTNPLNRSSETERDFTVTVVPGVDSTLRIGRGRVISKTSLEWVYFREFVSQRSVNLNQEARLELRLNRLTPYGAGSLLRTRQRPNAEIDLRVQQNIAGGALGTGIRVGPRLTLDLEARRARYEFGKGRHADRAVADALNRDVESASLSTRFALTRLTTLVVQSQMQRERFEVAVRRNANSLSIVPGFELKPSALIAGQIFVGFRRFDALDPTVPDFNGIVGRIDAHYTMRESTRFGFVGERNTDYSIFTDQPYYVVNSGMVTVTQILGGDWYAVGRLGESRLDYRDFVESDTRIRLDSSFIDRVLTRGVGFGRKLGDDIRVGVDVDYVRRRSNLAAREYDGFRLGGSFSYGH